MAARKCFICRSGVPVTTILTRLNSQVASHDVPVSTGSTLNYRVNISSTFYPIQEWVGMTFLKFSGLRKVTSNAVTEL